MYNCKVYHESAIFNNNRERIILLDITVNTLKDIAKELDMTYQQVADLNSRGTRKYQKFKYFPKIEIIKI